MNIFYFSSPIILLIPVILWGAGAFLNRLAVEYMSALLMQCIIGLVYILYIPFALKFSGINFNYQFSWYSIGLTALATMFSIAANIILFTYLKGNISGGASNLWVGFYPVVTLLLSIIFLHEKLTLFKIIGILFMICGGIFLTL